MKRTLSLMLTLVLILGIFVSVPVTVNAASLSQTQFEEKLSSAKKQYPSGSQKYEWSVNGSVVGWQCHGYGRWLSWYVWGVDFANGRGTNWTLYKATSSSTPVDKLVPGDVVRYRNSTSKTYNHTIFITSISGDTIYFTDCNSDGANTIKWNRSMTKSTLNSYMKISLYGSEAATYGYVAHYTLNNLSSTANCTCSTTYAGNYTCTTSSSPLTIRSGHGTSYSSLGSIPSGATVYVSKANGSWAHVSYNGISGYASMEYLKKVCSHSYKEEYEAAHPHRVYKKCYSCNDWYYTGATKNLSSCTSCNPKHYVVSVWASEKGKGYQYNECPAVTTGTVGTRYYIWYKMYDKNSGALYSENKNYTATISIYNPDGTLLHSTNYNKSNSNWISVVPSKTGSYKMNIKLTGDITANYSQYLNISCNGTVSFDKTSMNLTIPSKQSDTVKITLTGQWPSGAKVVADYNPSIISYSLSDKTFTITAKETGTTNFSIIVKDENGDNIAGATCEVTVKKATYCVDFEADGGKNCPEYQKILYGERVTISDARPQKTGYKFRCWTTNADGSGEEYYPGESFPVYEDVVLHAYFIPIEYIIEQDDNGADEGTVSSVVHTYDVAKELKGYKLKKYGYTFLGWSTNPNATVPMFTNEESVKNLSSVDGSKIIIYAVWKEGHYGDVDNNGIVDFNDILLMNKIIKGSVEPTLWNRVMGDVDGDGELTSDDVNLLNKFRLGQTDVFTVDAMSPVLMINTAAKKLNYYTGDSVNTDGLSLLIYYQKTQVAYDVTPFCKIYLPSTGYTGNKTVSIAFNGLRTSYDIMVSQPSITLSAKTKTIDKGDMGSITATTKPAGQVITWSSSNTSIATVSNGKITAIAPGSVTITAKFTYNGVTYTESCKVTVVNSVHSHTLGNWITDKAATVNAPGQKHQECTVCGAVVKTEIIPQLKTATPKLTKISNTGSGVMVTWATVGGADNYIVYRSVYDTKTSVWSSWESVADGLTSTSYVDKNVKSGIYYRYTIEALNEAGNSGYDTTGIMICYLTIPKVTSMANTTSGVTVKWGKVSGAEGYYVYRKTTGDWTRVATIKIGSTVSYTDKTAKAGVTYRYTVKAYSDSYTSSNKTSAEFKRLTTPKVTSMANTTNGVTVKWEKVSGANGYYVYRKTTGDWTRVATIKSGSIVSYTDKTAKAGVTYRYTVKAYSDSYTSSNKTSAEFKRLTTPKVTSMANTTNGVTVKWEKVSGANGYYVYRKTTGDWTRVATIKSGSTVSYTDKTAKAGVTYRYTVKAYSGSYTSSNQTSTDFRRLITPTLKSAVSSKTGITFTWNKVTGATGYIVYRKTGSGSWQRLGTVKTNTYLDKTAKKGVTYKYTVKAYYGTSTSHYNSKGLTIKDKY